MRKTHADLARMDKFRHCFFSLCDSHGLQLLVKDILQMECFKDISDSTAFITTFFKKSKLQLARLRNEMMEHWGHVRSFITACLTRWGSNFKAIESVQRARRPLQRYARQPDVLADSEKPEHKLLPTVLLKINDPLFRHQLDIILAILEPVCKAQLMSEADRANVGHVIPRWHGIVAEWQKIEAGKQYPNVPWPQLYNLHTLRMTKQTYDLHFAAFALRPDTVNTPLTPEFNRKAISFLETTCSQEDSLMLFGISITSGHGRVITLVLGSWFFMRNSNHLRPGDLLLIKAVYSDLLQSESSPLFATPSHQRDPFRL